MSSRRVCIILTAAFLFLPLSGLLTRLAYSTSGASSPVATPQAQQASADSKGIYAPEATGIEVSALVLEASRFCEYGDKAYMAYFPMDVTVANGRRTPIILAQALHIQRVLIGKSIAEVQAKQYELATQPRLLRTAGQSTSFGPLPSPDAFSVLKHNQTYEFTAVEGIPVRKNAADSVPGTIYPGDLFVSIELQTWPYSRDAQSLQGQWTKYGDLISAPVISLPTAIKLPASPILEKCGLMAR
ncbi:MAG TPA: hypothetical protein VKZ53_07210 [Candidatus Angelobacter sp.]|nr:hypothetical protein [Candidatus Angelobacter sp.]